MSHTVLFSAFEAWKQGLNMVKHNFGAEHAKTGLRCVCWYKGGVVLRWRSRQVESGPGRRRIWTHTARSDEKNRTKKNSQQQGKKPLKSFESWFFNDSIRIVFSWPTLLSALRSNLAFHNLPKCYLQSLHSILVWYLSRENNTVCGEVMLAYQEVVWWSQSPRISLTMLGKCDHSMLSKWFDSSDWPWLAFALVHPVLLFHGALERPQRPL